MKKFLLFVFLITPIFSFCQVLIETLEGEEIVINSGKFPEKFRIITNINSSAEAIQAKAYFRLDSTEIISKKTLLFGYKIKPSEGIAKLIADGNVSSSMTFNVAYSHYLGSSCFFNLLGAYNIEKSILFDPERDYGKQIDEFNYKGVSLVASYNYLYKGSYLITGSFGYARKNNYSDLTKIEVSEYSFLQNPNDSTLTTGYGKVTDARIGDYKKYDSYPLKISLTYLPIEDRAKANDILPGGCLYYSCSFSNMTPNHKIGAVIFITKQDSKTGVRAPVLGIGTQLNDLTDNLDTGKTIGKRISVNLSATIAIL